ncbi:glycosyltransferase family 2 protein [Candidatus Njordibacter sp. Uisw_039]|uniref:glycosyltransferase family 2 protein n=1 Tax=Candidatus Njordibacter sp. Uisw_039 TaxID=3230972 RepID=UPI003D5B0C0B
MKIFSIVIPVFQNEENVHNTVTELLALQEKIEGYSLQLIFVDDGSTDRSYELLNEYYLENSSIIKLVKLTKNFGQGQSIRTGIRVADGDCIGVISADLQDPPELFLDMLKHWESGVKLVIGERNNREEGFTHRIFSNAYWRFVNKYAVEGFPIGGFDFCLLDRQIKTSLDAINERNTSIFPLIFWLGYGHTIIHYQRRLRKAGKSQWTLTKKIQLTIDTIIGFTHLPVRFISAIGLGLSGLSFFYTTYLTFKWLVYGTTVEGWTSLAVLIGGIGGLTLFSLSIIAEYLWRILDEERKRPLVIVDSIKADKMGELGKMDKLDKLDKLDSDA